MEVLLDGRKRKASGSTVRGIVESLGLSPEETLVKVNGRLASDGTKVCPKDEVKVMRVIFGG